MASLMLAAYFVLASAGAQGAVLCVGEDGHLAIEFGCSGESCPAPETPGMGTSTENCGSCVDTPLMSNLARMIPQTDRSILTVAPGLQAETIPLVLLPDPARVLPHEDPPPVTLSLILRTNVLLI
jgi:hypothetical protein